MKSKFFYGDAAKSVTNELKNTINESSGVHLSKQTAGSPRAAGDAVELFVADNMQKLLGSWCKEYSATFARRSMADIAFSDKQGFYCMIDVKTHRIDTDFNMPNLTSAHRLLALYEDDTNIFALLMVCYELQGLTVKALNVHFVPIEFLDWRCLTIGALGWGQIQIANSNRIKIQSGFSRKEWMIMLCEKMLDFYPREITKIEGRMQVFSKAKSLWQKRDNTWV